MNLYQYKLSADQKQYKISKKLAVSNVQAHYYKYKHNYTLEQITDFVCNNNLKLSFVSSPYQGSKQQGYDIVYYEAEKQTYAFDC